MWKQQIYASVVAASMVILPVERAQASDAAKIIGGTIAVLGIREILRHNNQPGPKVYVDSAQRQQNRQVQSALNYFGYNVGVVDGSLGPRSRAAISQYQAQMGFNPDGRLDAYESNFLTGSHQRALASAHVPPYNQIMATQGPAGLLRSFRNADLGLANTPTPGYPTPGHSPVPVPQPRPEPNVIPLPIPEPSVSTRDNVNALPVFPVTRQVRSMSEHCNEINVLTAANGGISTPGRINDAEFALNEQFCLARTHAMADTTRITSAISGLGDAEFQAQCEGLTKVIKPQMETVNGGSPDRTIRAAATVLDRSGQPMEQLIMGGKVCLGIGYRIDDAEMALASAVLLTAAGETGYGEAVSHHLREGFGAPQSDASSHASWMSMAIDLVRANPSAAVMSQSADRIAVLNGAMGANSGVATAALPVFSTNN